MSIMDNSIVSTCLSNNILKALHMAIAVIYYIYNTSFILNWGRGGAIYTPTFTPKILVFDMSN